MTEKVVQEKDISLWQVLVALITDPGSRAAFREGWKRGTTMWEAEQQAKAAETEKLRLQKAAETQDKGDDSDGRIKCSLPNSMIVDTYFHQPYLDADVMYDPYGETEL